MTTEQSLNSVATAINKTMHTPVTQYIKVDGKHSANVGHYHIENQSGYWNLVQMTNETGGTHRICTGRTKGELYQQMTAYHDGLRAGRDSYRKEYNP